MRGWRAVPYTALWAAARALELAGRASIYLAAGTLRLSELREAIGRAWAKFAHHEHEILSGLMSWEEALFGRFLKPDDHILLIGCGTGRDLIALLRRGHRVTGLDPAAGALALARHVMDKQQLVADLHTGSIETFTPSGRFDAVIFSWHCYGYIPQAGHRIDVLRKLKGHLHPGGRILISYLPAEPAPGRLPIRLTRLVARLTRSDWQPEPGDIVGTATGDHGALHYEHRFEDGEFAREAEAAGLTVVFHERADEGTAVLTA